MGREKIQLVWYPSDIPADIKCELRYIRQVAYRERRTVVRTISNYVKAKTLEEAYELNQARSSRVMGGMMWMRLGNARVKTVIDLSRLGLDQIEESDNVIKIGVMCTLRQIEESEALREMYGDGIAESVRHIVGVQVRNQATVGGSIYG